MNRSGPISRNNPLKAAGKLRQKSTRKPTRAYRVKDGVMTYEGGREVCQNTAAGRAEYDLRRKIISERQGHLCPVCGGPLRSDETFDHQDGRTAGRKDERLLMEDGVTWRNAVLHAFCNQQIGSVRHCWIAGNTKYVPLACVKWLGIEAA